MQDPKTRVGRMSLYSKTITEISIIANEYPARVLALAYRESWLGFAPGYQPKGDPTGRGDQGHGRGLFQIDDRYHSNFVNSAAFKNPAEQCWYACGLLHENRQEILQALPDLKVKQDYLERCVYAAYNASMHRVLEQAKKLADPDEVTTGKNYSKYIFTLADAVESSYPSLTELPW